MGNFSVFFPALFKMQEQVPVPGHWISYEPGFRDSSLYPGIREPGTGTWYLVREEKTERKFPRSCKCVPIGRACEHDTKIFLLFFKCTSCWWSWYWKKAWSFHFNIVSYDIFFSQYHDHQQEVHLKSHKKFSFAWYLYSKVFKFQIFYETVRQDFIAQYWLCVCSSPVKLWSIGSNVEIEAWSDTLLLWLSLVLVNISDSVYDLQ